jgi:hypothetical protein
MPPGCWRHVSCADLRRLRLCRYGTSGSDDRSLLNPLFFFRPPRDDFCLRRPFFALDVVAVRLRADLVDAPRVDPLRVDPVRVDPVRDDPVRDDPLLRVVRRFVAPALLLAVRRFEAVELRDFDAVVRFDAPDVLRLLADLRLVAFAMFGLLLRTNGNACNYIMFLAMEPSASSSMRRSFRALRVQLAIVSFTAATNCLSVNGFGRNENC